MKSLFLTLTACLCVFSLHATIITVDNNTVSAGQYTDLQVAANNANAGDTLHIIGSLTSYGNLQLEKQLTLIGAGYNSPNQFNLSSQIGTLYFSEVLPDNSSGSKLMGLSISVISWWVNNATYDNITIERCEINNISMSTDDCTGWVIQNNIISSLSVGNNANLVIRNNIIRSQISSSNEPTVLITNNLFTKATSVNYFSNISGATISNNIFYQGGGPQGCASSTFNNNISWGTSNNTLPYGTNIGTGNLIADPQFNNVPGSTYAYAYDYRYPASSPGASAGTDGTDIGIYGGIAAFPIGGDSPFLTSAPPRIPQIMELNLLNATIFQGDSLTVQIRARKQN